jgi:long-chain acyl-CoA synthetase
MLVEDALRHAAKLRPGHPAVIDGTRSLTYAELEERVRRLAAGLRGGLGLRPADRFAFLSTNRLEFVEVFLAAAAARVTCVPLNYRLTAFEIAEILADSGARAVIAERALEDRLTGALEAGFDGQVVWLAPAGADDSAYEQLLAGGAARAAAAPGAPSDIVLQPYTSGTTGLPKGVMLSHRNVLANAWTLAAEGSVTASDRYLSCAPLCHLAAGSRVFLLTHVGATHVIHPAFDAVRAVHEMRDGEVNATMLVPTMIRRVLEVAREQRISLGGRVRMITYGTAPMPLDLLSEALELLGCDFQQGYGLTEASPNLTLLPPEDHRPGASGEPSARLASVGRESIGVNVRVVDEHDDDVEPGAIGEVIARGGNIMEGYWRRPDETAEALRGGWLRTGDLATVDADSYVYLVDRKKDMLVSGGFNVYPGEIERQLQQHALVRESAVVGRADEQWGEVPVAFVVLASDGAAGEAETALGEFCRSRLARFKVPESFRIVDELPRTTLGKVDKRALRRAVDASA